MSSFKHWTEQEVTYLKSSFGKLTCKQIARNLGRTGPAVKCMANRIGLSRRYDKWSYEDVEFLKRSYPHEPIASIAQQLNRSEAAVRARARVEKLRRHSSWSDHDIDFLTKNFRVLTIRQIADAIGKSPGAVSSKAYLLGISRLPEQKKFKSPATALAPARKHSALPKIKQQSWIPL